MKIQRILNQNRISVIVSVLIAIFIIVIIQVINAIYKNSDNKKANQNTITIAENIPYEKESETIISDTKVTKDDGIVYGNIIEGFLNYCVKGNVEEAYNMLSEDCKNIYYNTLEDFENTYYKNKFSEKRKYEFQSWIAGDKNVYQIQLYNDMLSSGKASSKYILDYYTVVEENGKYKLNINNFIGKEKINTSYKEDGISINIESVEIYKENSVYNLTITNNTEKTIKLDGRKNTKTVYIQDENGTKFKSQLYELLDEDLIINPGEEKNIKIKFNIIYRDDLELKYIVFNDVIMDYENKEESNIKQISIEI